MKQRIVILFLVVLALGAIAMHWRVSQQEPVSPPERDTTSTSLSAETNLLPSKDADPWTIPAGNWISLDGRQVVRIERASLRFADAPGWPDLSGKSFPLGSETRFRSESGSYVIAHLDDEPDRITFIREDAGTKELTSFRAYRDGSAFARSRKPLPVQAARPGIQALLEFIPSIRRGESWRSVNSRCPVEIKDLGNFDRDTSLGETHLVLELDPAKEWFLQTDHGNSGIYRFRVVRGILNADGDLEVTEYHHPSYFDGKIITGVSDTGGHLWHTAEGL